MRRGQAYGVGDSGRCRSRAHLTCEMQRGGAAADSAARLRGCSIEFCPVTCSLSRCHTALDTSALLPAHQAWKCKTAASERPRVGSRELPAPCSPGHAVRPCQARRLTCERRQLGRLRAAARARRAQDGPQPQRQVGARLARALAQHVALAQRGCHQAAGRARAGVGGRQRHARQERVLAQGRHAPAWQPHPRLSQVLLTARRRTLRPGTQAAMAWECSQPRRPSTLCVFRDAAAQQPTVAATPPWREG